MGVCTITFAYPRQQLSRHNRMKQSSKSKPPKKVRIFPLVVIRHFTLHMSRWAENVASTHIAGRLDNLAYQVRGVSTLSCSHIHQALNAGNIRFEAADEASSDEVSESDGESDWGSIGSELDSGIGSESEEDEYDLEDLGEDTHGSLSEGKKDAASLMSLPRGLKRKVTGEVPLRNKPSQRTDGKKVKSGEDLKAVVPVAAIAKHKAKSETLFRRKNQRLQIFWQQGGWATELLCLLLQGKGQLELHMKATAVGWRQRRWADRLASRPSSNSHEVELLVSFCVRKMLSLSFCKQNSSVEDELAKAIVG